MNHVLVSLVIATVVFLNLEETSFNSTQGVSVRQHPYYAPYIVPALKQLAIERGHTKTNHFYISKVEELGNGYYRALVYWKENRALIYWEPKTGFDKRGNFAPQYDLVMTSGGRYISLDEAVIEKPPVNSNYLITRAMANRMIRECLKGDRFVIIRPAPKYRRRQSNNDMHRSRRSAFHVVAGEAARRPGNVRR